MEEILNQLSKNLRESEVCHNEPMKKHTSFRVGGIADIFIDASIKDIPIIMEIASKHGMPITVIGNGTNLLVGDGGIRGITMCIGKNSSKIEIDEGMVYAQAGALLSSVSKLAANDSLTGLEFASGIPGSIGGATVMNAGAYDGSMSDCIIEVTYIDKDSCRTNTINGKECDFSYRHSIFLDKNMIVTDVKLQLEKGEKAYILEKIQDLSNKRKEKQPIEYPSAGSTFKRPPGQFAGKLIMDAGLKGFSIGDACVSSKHAGFVINQGNATAKDIKNLMEEVINRVDKEFGVVLEPEVRLVGDFY